MLLLAPWAFIAFLFRDVGEVLDTLGDASVGAVAGGFALQFASVVLVAVLWARLVVHLNREVTVPDTPHLVRSFTRSWLARYIPGLAVSYGARFLHTDAQVVPRRILTISLVDEFALGLGATTASGLGLWTWGLAGPLVGLPVLAATLAAVIVAVTRIDRLAQLVLRLLGRRLSQRPDAGARSGRPPGRWQSLGEELEAAAQDPGLGLRAAAVLAGGYLMVSVAGGFAFALVLWGLGDLGWGDLPLAAGGYNLAVVVGLVAVFAPVGLGVREAVLVGFVAPIASGPVAASAALSFRALTVIADVLLFAVVEAVTALARRGAGGGPPQMGSSTNRTPG